MKVLIVCTYYPDFLDALYGRRPALGETEFEAQSAAIFGTGFGVSDAYSSAFQGLKEEAGEVICNADRLQARWAAEHGMKLVDNIHDRRRQIVFSQIKDYRPDVLFVFEWSPLGDGFLAEMKQHVRLVVGQVASPLPATRTYGAYDLMVSSWPPMVDYFRSQGIGAEYLRLGFDPRTLRHVVQGPPEFETTFVGGFAPSHQDRAAWLERLLQRVQVDVFGYGLQNVDAQSPIRRHHHGEAWGWSMYQVLRQSKLTLNRHAHIDIRGSVSRCFANNMRLYEATGIGTCLITEWRDNLSELFAPDQEVVTYRTDEECIEKIEYYRTHDAEREAIAAAGRLRTHRNHTYAHRIAELREILKKHL